MKLLILTQKVDRHDDILGFFHGWLQRFAEQCTRLTVVCLQQGPFSLPEHVRVLSLGKEHGRSRIKYLIRFYRFILRERRNYDAVLVHMNPVYVVLGKPLWGLWHKRCLLWHNHAYGSLTARAGVMLADTACYTSPFSFAARFGNARRMPAGIDVDRFAKDASIQKTPGSLLYVGRIAPVKKVHVLIEAALMLHERGKDFVLNIVGEAQAHDAGYLEALKQQAAPLEQQGKLRFPGKVPNHDTPAIYNQHRVLINLSPAGLFDKTVLEAMACETLAMVSSSAFRDILPEKFLFKEGDAQSLADGLERILGLAPQEQEHYGRRLREHIVRHHNLDTLVTEILRCC